MSIHQVANFIINKIVKTCNLLLIPRNSYQTVLFYKGDTAKLPELSVVIPVIEKDLPVLRLNVSGLRQYCQNPITNIYVVSPKSDKIVNLCKELNLIWFDESTVAPITKEVIYKSLKDSFLVNWFYQQFLKLNFNTIVNTSHYLVIDADTILLSHQYFLDNTHMILKSSDEYHYMYQITNRSLLPDLKFTSRSFIAHHQLISKEALLEIKMKITGDNIDKFWDILLTKIQRNNNYFSEYELYGGFMSQYHRDKVKIVYWYNKNSYSNKFTASDLPKLNGKYISVSFHNYNYQTYAKH